MEQESNWNSDHVNEQIKKHKGAIDGGSPPFWGISNTNMNASQILSSIDKAHADERRKWLDDTQNMRVVSLNEAVRIAVASIENEMENVSAENIVNVAHVFAKFLIDGEYE